MSHFIEKINKFFEGQYENQKKLLEKKLRGGKQEKKQGNTIITKRGKIIACIIPIVLLLIVIFFNVERLEPIFLISMAIPFIAYRIEVAPIESFRSASVFLKRGIQDTMGIGLFYFLTFCFSFLGIFPNMFESTNSSTFAVVVTHVAYFLFILVLAMMWFLFSTFANARVATISNAILTMVIGIFLQLNSFYVTILKWDNVSIDFLFNKEQLVEIKQLGLDQHEFLATAINFIMFPAFTAVAVGTAGAALKKYWLVKYKKDQDVM